MTVDNHHRPGLLIADDHVFLAEACKCLLEDEFQVVGTVGNGRDLLQVAEPLKPDVVILDIAMPEMNGLDACEQLKQMLPSCKLVFMTMDMDPDVAAEAFRRGASGYVVKSATVAELVTAIRRALRSERYLSPLVSRDRVAFLLRRSASFIERKRLTPRQLEVLRLFAEGMSMKEIARTLSIKPRTVAFHKYSMMEALGIESNAELFQYAIRHHLTS